MILVYKDKLDCPVMYDADLWDFINKVEAAGWDGSYDALLSMVAENASTTQLSEVQTYLLIPEHEWQLRLLYNTERGTWHIDSQTETLTGYCYEVYLTQCARCDMVRAMDLVGARLG